MELQTRSDGPVTTLSPIGSIDTRTSMEFEEAAMAALGQGATSMVCDLSRVDLVTSAGLRVLVMLGKHVQRRQGRLVLCGLNEYVRSVFDVSGMLALFTIDETADAARARLSGISPGREAKTSTLARHVARLLARGDAVPAESADSLQRTGKPSALARAVSTILDRADEPPATM
jgi:stage II sporulation protein AA (anti-sigma F factor antagonist)